MPDLAEILLLHHSHFDVGYTHPQPVAWELQRRFIDQALELCERTADWPAPSQVRWTCEVTAPLLHWLESAGGRALDRFARLARAGRLSAGALLCNTTPLCDAEQLARQLYPIQELRARFGLPLRTAMNHDVNGLPWPLSQLLLDAGVELLLMGVNIHLGAFPLRRPLAFRWRASDGRELLAFNGEHYGTFGRALRLREGTLEAMAEGWVAYAARLRAQEYPYDFAFLTATHRLLPDNAPPDAATAELVRRWNDEGRRPLIRFVTPEQLLERLRAQPPETLPVHGGDWTDYWNFGAGSTARETRVHAETRARLATLELLQASALGAPTRRSAEPPMPSWGSALPTAHQAEAWRNLDFYAEHTWGAASSISQPDTDGGAAQSALKSNCVWQARALTSLLLRDHLERLAGNAGSADPQVGRSSAVEQGLGAQGVLLVNAAPVERETVLRVPRAWADGTLSQLTGAAQALDVNMEKWSAAETRAFGPVKLAPYSWRVVSLKELSAPPEPPGCAADGERIVAQASSLQARLAQTEAERLQAGSLRYLESPFYRLEYNSATGRITGLYDKRLAWPVSDDSSPWPFFGFVQETPDPARHRAVPPQFGRDAFFDFNYDRIHANLPCWRADWSALRRGPSRLVSCRAEVVAEGARLTLVWDAPGVADLTQHVLLCANRPALELSASYHKQERREPEALYFAFPLNLAPAWRAYFDTAGLPVELDSEQLPGACRDYLTVGTYVAVQEGGHGVTLACPDAPLVQVGGFHFAKCQARVERPARPLLLAWPVNNYWNTNFPASQPGFNRLRYELTSQAAFDPAAALRFGLGALMPVEIHPVFGDAGSANPQVGPSGRLIELEGAGLVLFHAKPSGDGRAVIFRVANQAGARCSGVLRLPGRAIQRAWRAGTLEAAREPLAVRAGAVQLELPARALWTVRVEV